MLLLNAVHAYGSDTYIPANGQLTIPTMALGGTTYSNLVVTVGHIVSGPSGTSANGNTDSYDPSKGKLTVPSVAVGSRFFYNVVVTVSNLDAVGGVSGADSYDGSSLVISAVQVLGGSNFTNVVVTVHSVLGVAGGMPGNSHDSYDAATGHLVIPAVTYRGNVYSNVTVAIGNLLAVGGPGTCVSKISSIACTQSGLIQGAIEGNYRAFRGIPFAAPPVGNLRWRPPAAPAFWQGLRNTTAFGNECPQTDFNGGVAGDEDCLTLNIFGINPIASSKQPVMVFFHGGGWKIGSAQYAPFNNIPRLVDNGVIVVTVQYRLGLLGFFAHPLLTAEGNGSSGNYGFEDSIAALQWVHDNIAHFGGDPAQVMIFGQSAGSESVQTLLASPAAQGLFASAGMESGADAPGWWGSSLADAYALYANFVPLACPQATDVLACLRALSANAVVLTQLVPGKFPYMAPSIEPRVLPEDSFDRLQRLGSPVPLLIGSNHDEDFADNDLSQVMDAAQYAAALTTKYGASAGGQVLAQYPANFDSNNPWYAYIDVQTDHDYTWEVRNLARAASGAQRPPVWRYLFTHSYENDAYLNSLRAFHTAELNFVGGNFQQVYYIGLPYTPTSDEITLSDEIIGYWTRFAKTGNPNGAGAAGWLPYDVVTESIMQLDTTHLGPLPGVGYRNAECDLLQTLPF